MRESRHTQPGPCGLLGWAAVVGRLPGMVVAASWHAAMLVGAVGGCAMSPSTTQDDALAITRDPVASPAPTEVPVSAVVPPARLDPGDAGVPTGTEWLAQELTAEYRGLPASVAIRQVTQARPVRLDVGSGDPLVDSPPGRTWSRFAGRPIGRGRPSRGP